VSPADHVHLIELPLGPRRTVNAVLVDGEPLTLVDTGVRSDESLAALEAALAARGRRIGDLEQIVITHAHPDHFGAAAELVRRSGARVVGDGAEAIAGWPESAAPRRGFRQACFDEAGVPEEIRAGWRSRGEGWPFADEPVPFERRLVEGDELAMGGRAWRVVSTPGHDSSSIALYQPEERLLITGDIVVGNGGASVTLHPLPRPARWLLDIFDSLEKLARLEAEVAYPGHGPLLRGASAAITEKLARARQRLEEVAGLIGEAPRSAYEVACALYPPELARAGLGLSQSIGYLEALEALGRASSELRRGVRRYAPPSRAGELSPARARVDG
jgi:glyoxylase-like metal-dependent hydrolase (beta-lactamase superfamily II)